MPKGYGESCGLSPCVDGLACSLAEDVPGCFDQLCGTAFCDLNQPNTCPGAPAQRCLGYFQQKGAETPLGWEHLGTCAVP